METIPTKTDKDLAAELPKPKRAYTKREGVKYGRPKKPVCNQHPPATTEQEAVIKQDNGGMQ